MHPTVRSVAANENGYSPLLYAARNGHEAVVKIIVVHDDIEVNTKDQDGCSLLSYINKYGNEAAVKMLVSQDNVEVNTKDKTGHCLMPWKMGMRRW